MQLTEQLKKNRATYELNNLQAIASDERFVEGVEIV